MMDRESSCPNSGHGPKVSAINGAGSCRCRERSSASRHRNSVHCKTQRSKTYVHDRRGVNAEAHEPATDSGKSKQRFPRQRIVACYPSSRRFVINTAPIYTDSKSFIAATSCLTASTLLRKSAVSFSVKSNSMISSTPPLPITTGTPT